MTRGEIEWNVAWSTIGLVLVWLLLSERTAHDAIALAWPAIALLLVWDIVLTWWRRHDERGS